MTDTPRMPASLATRMGWHLLVPLALVWAVGTGMSVWLAWQSTQRGLDRALVDDAQAIASSVRLAPADASGVRQERPATGSLAGQAPGAAASLAATPAPPRLVTGLNADELGFLLFDHDDSTFFAIFDGQGRMLAGHPGMVLRDTPAQANAFVLRDAVFEGQRVRQATLRKDLPAPFYVIAAETTRTRADLWRQLLLYAVLPQAVLLVLLAWWLRRSIVADLRPLASLNEALAARGAKDLSPVSADHPNRELVSLASSVNGLLERLQASIRGHREFVGNVAHELRTPLAGMRALAEHGLAQSDPARWREPLVQIVQVSERASHLTRQLLALALAQEARSEAEFVPLRLDEAVREAVLRHQARARQLQVDQGARQQDGQPPGARAPAAGGSGRRGRGGRRRRPRDRAGASRVAGGTAGQPDRQRTAAWPTGRCHGGRLHGGAMRHGGAGPYGARGAAVCGGQRPRHSGGGGGEGVRAALWRAWWLWPGPVDRAGICPADAGEGGPDPCPGWWRGPLRGRLQSGLRVRMAERAASTVWSRSACECAALTNPASYSAGAR